MEIKKIENGSTLTIGLVGRLDTTSAPSLEAEINAMSDGITALILDFEGLEYISSAGLRVVLAAQKKMNAAGSLTVTHVNDDVMDVFDITGFSDILTIE